MFKHWISQKINLFTREQRGAVALIFGMSLLPILGTVGAGVDYSRALKVKTSMSNALDGAILALGRESGLEGADAQLFVKKFIDANFKSDYGVDWQLNSVMETDGVLSADISMSVETLTLDLVGKDTINMGVKTKAKREISNLEIVMVLDNTGSMNGGNKIGALRDSARQLVDLLDSSVSAGISLKVGLVPFITAVNVKAEANEGFNSSWIDTQGRSVLDFVQFDEATSGKKGPKNNWALFNTLGVPWKGCVQARPSPYDLTDDEPKPSNPDTLFVPYFWPDEPDVTEDYHNNYLPDFVVDAEGLGDGLAPEEDWTLEMRQKNVAKYIGLNEEFDETPSHTMGPNKSCANPLLPLTDNMQKVRQRISDMRAWNNSGTVISEGVAWGWRVLSPGKPFTQGVSYEDTNTRKVMIIMTDGDNQIWGGWSGHNKSDYTSYGYLAENRLDTTNKNSAKGVINSKVDTVCQRVKNLDIEVYTVTLKINSNAIFNLFRDCATDPQMSFNTQSNNELEQAFIDIAKDMTYLRLLE